MSGRGSTVGWTALILVTGLASAPAGLAQSASGGDGPLDCTIEPKVVAEIGSADEGIIDDILVERGDAVEKGQVLAQLDSRIEKLAVELTRLQAQQDVEIRSRQARLGYQHKETERARTLFDKKIVSDQALDEAQVQEDIARLDVEFAAVQQKVAQAEHALARARLERRTIRSPVAGIVVDVGKAPGEFIHEQAPLLTLARIDELNVEVFVPVPRYGRIRPGETAIVEPAAPIGGRHEAVVEVVDRVFDAASATFGVRLRLPNPDGSLPAGIRCKVTFASAHAGE
jgi:RND family efflux transporter MFP subunit